MSNGNKTHYYSINTKGKKTIDVDDICEAYGFSFAEGNALKALVGIAKARESGETRHTGTTSNRDANKLVHYAKRIQESLIESPSLIRVNT